MATRANQRRYRACQYSRPKFIRGGIRCLRSASESDRSRPGRRARRRIWTTDEQTGQITFTDRPQSYEEQAGKQVSQTSVNTGESSAPKGMPSEVRGNTDLPAAAATKPAVNINYQLSMIEPSTERAYQRPAQSIVIALDVKPALQNGDQVSIYLDDKEIAQGLSASVATVDLQPGPHSIRAVVKTVSGQTRQQVNRTVHVIQNTLILQKKKKLAEQLLAVRQRPEPQR